MSLAVLSFIFTASEANEPKDEMSCPRASRKSLMGQETQPVALPRYKCSSKVAHELKENFSLSGLIHFTVPLQIQGKSQGLPMWLGSAAALI